MAKPFLERVDRDVMAPECPSNARIKPPLIVQTIVVPSKPAVKTVFSSYDMVTHVTGPAWPPSRTAMHVLVAISQTAMFPVSIPQSAVLWFLVRCIETTLPELVITSLMGGEPELRTRYQALRSRSWEAENMRLHSDAAMIRVTADVWPLSRKAVAPVSTDTPTISPSWVPATAYSAQGDNTRHVTLDFVWCVCTALADTISQVTSSPCWLAVTTKRP